jgi:hypothetical protein
VDLYHSGSNIEDRKTVACTWHGCEKKFVKRSNLNVHVKAAHLGVRFVCGEVDTFGTQDITDWNWMEEGCGESFVSKMKLEEHVRFVHLGRKRPKKELISVWERKPNIVDDISGVTEIGKRNIACGIAGCGAKFIRYHDLGKHLQNHQHYELGAVDAGGEYGTSAICEPGGHEPGEPEAEQFWFSAGDGMNPPEQTFDDDWARMRELIDFDECEVD